MNLKTSRYRGSGVRVGCALLSIVALSHTVLAQQPRTPIDTRLYISSDRGLSVDEVVALALEGSPTVLAARARVDGARGERLQASLRPNPTVMTDHREEVGGADRQTTIGVNWPLDLFRRSGRVDVADQRIALAEQEAAEVERTLASNVRTKILQLLASVRQWEVRGQIASTLSQFRDLVGARTESGAAPPLERDVADVDARRADAEVLRQQAAVEAALAELKGLIGWTADQPFVLRQSLEELAHSGGVLSRVPAAPADQLLGARPDVRLAEAQVMTATAELNLIHRERKPELTLSAGYMRMNSGFPLFAVDAFGVRAPINGVFHNVSIGAAMTLPWRDRRQGDLAAATARIRAVRFDLQNRKIAAAAEVDAARSRVQQLEGALSIYTDGLRALARKNVEVFRQSYQLGRGTLIDVLTETRRLLETETAYTDLLLETLQARSDLASAMGVVR